MRERSPAGRSDNGNAEPRDPNHRTVTPGEMTCQQHSVGVRCRAVETAVLAAVVVAVVCGRTGTSAAQGRAAAHPAARHAGLRCGARGGRLRARGRAGPLQRSRRRHLPRRRRRDLRHPGQGPLRTASSVEQFQRTPDIDLVSRRLTWSLQREGMGLLFGPVMFYDGQGFLVPARIPAQTGPSTSNARICVVAGRLERVQPDDLLPVAPADAAKSPDSTRASGSGARRPAVVTPSPPTSRSWVRCGARCGSPATSGFCRSRSPRSRSRSWCAQPMSICSTCCAGRFSR